ncbi:ABC transporter permease [Jiangella muralis]|uniref:ABC transporter permease n=1 Tax=Jiangella muralis TaxID=702383 RepID=UPI00069F3C65|nr:ABC transporter permease [Jiangella muralis]
MSIAWYILRRLGVGLLLLVIASFFVFCLLYISPGSPEQVLLGGRPSTPEIIGTIRAKYNLDDPFLVQYGQWLLDAFRLDFGESIVTDQPVTTVLTDRAGPTLALALAGLVLTIVIAVPAGMYAAAKRNTSGDRMVSMLTLLGSSAPTFAVGVLLLYVFGVSLEWFPVFGNGTGFTGQLHHLVLPAIALAVTQIAYVTRQTRAAALRVYEQDYVTFARSRGLGRSLIWRRYALLNSSLPIVTATGLLLAYTLGGAVLVEVTFSREGVGSLMLQAVQSKDIPVVQGLVAFAAITVTLVNLGVDLVNLAIDPRLRKEVTG